MKLLRHYFISNSLDDLEVFEEQLEASGITTPQIHVLSMHDTEVAHHDHLNYVQSFMKKDIIHSVVIGTVVGICLAASSLIAANLVGWTDTAAGWTPFILLAIAIFVFCIWEGGLIGIETPNYKFARFSEALKNDKHVFFIDLEPNQEGVLKQVIQSHPQLELAGTGSAIPHWLVVLEDRVPRFFKDTFP